MRPIDQRILDYLSDHPQARREAIKRAAAPDASETTVWRTLKQLSAANKVEVAGRGRATQYSIAGASAVKSHLRTPYNRRPPVNYNPSFIDAYIPGRSFYLPQRDRERLLEAGLPITGSIPAGTYARRILEQLLIDLSWASSRMEGNTYDILQTERLIHHGQEATGKDRKEALMILNHKEAIEYVVHHINELTLSRKDIFNIHALLSEGLLIDPGMAGRLRSTPVGISHSSYKPLEDGVLIQDEFDIILQKARAITDPFEQSFFLLVHIPYLQGFSDINKRTSRVASNIPLLKAELAPMSFLTMDDAAYIDALIGIYELNNVDLLGELYVESYLASADKYRFLKAEVNNPSKAALAYRGLVRLAVRHCVMETKRFDAEAVLALIAAESVPPADQTDVLAYARAQFQGLHEGNLIRYNLQPSDLQGVDLTAQDG